MGRIECVEQKLWEGRYKEIAAARISREEKQDSPISVRMGLYAITGRMSYMTSMVFMRSYHKVQNV